LKKQGGISGELMILFSIITIIAVIAIPNLLRGRIQGNEQAAVYRLNKIIGEQESFAKSHDGKYAVTFTELANEKTLPKTDYSMPLQGYRFSLSAVNEGEDYIITAAPAAPGRTGFKYFYTNRTGVIRQENNMPTTAASPKMN